MSTAAATAAAVARLLDSSSACCVGMRGIKPDKFPTTRVNNIAEIKNKSSRNAVPMPISVRYAPSIRTEYSMLKTTFIVGLGDERILHH